MSALLAADARKLFERMRGRRVLVVGDVMIDEWIWGDVTRISPEAPVPVVAVRDHSFTLGGAGNVANNLRRLVHKTSRRNRRPHTFIRSNHSFKRNLKIPRERRQA